MTTDEVIILHENAHFVVAGELGINSHPVLIPKSERQPEANGHVVAGSCIFDAQAKPTPFEVAVIGWAGVIIEALLGIENSLPDMPFDLCDDTLNDWYRIAMTCFEQLSLGDQQCICTYRRSTWATFKAAYRIVKKSKARILRLSELTKTKKEKDMRIHPIYQQTQQPPDLMHMLKDRTAPYYSFPQRAELIKKALENPACPDRAECLRVLPWLEQGLEPPPAPTAAELAAIAQLPPLISKELEDAV